MSKISVLKKIIRSIVKEEIEKNRTIIKETVRSIMFEVIGEQTVKTGSLSFLKEEIDNKEKIIQEVPKKVDTRNQIREELIKKIGVDPITQMMFEDVEPLSNSADGTSDDDEGVDPSLFLRK